MRKYLILAFVLLSAFSSYAQSVANDSISAKQEKEEKNFNFNLMPYMSYNRNLDFMYGILPLAMYRLNPNDTISPKSLSGLTGVFTTNGSKFIGFFNRWHLAEDKWRIQFYGATGNHISQFYYDYDVSPGFYDYKTKTTMVSIGVQRRILSELYFGLNYTFAHHFTEYEDEVQPDATTETHSLQYILLYDSRDEVYYPFSGKQIRLKWNSFPQWMGNDIEANKIITEYNTYFPARDNKDVIAARFSGTFGIGDIAFEQQVVIGGNDIRGYSEAKYRGDGLMAVQGEYRYNFANRMGLVGFAGLATIYGSPTEDFDWDLYPGFGVGYRYQAFKKAKFNIGLDAALGKDDWGVYFRIGEAF
ncbi:BamA/TamA family outer membrane protein [Draconibacterium sp. IB214405]|uniref:BamA/TamA family outer membrane protein n=1 Tax=Draconibacterium sp. IB214405 TaxID=3097352 RepID=UPI002A0E6D77|nr:BamA/TamA family outer membrane protein [Draconibacterium sp. IB214405]MDX8340495.1 BamA/TamA family outer membrane protein [Draconibacterium sp. IB214405]